MLHPLFEAVTVVLFDIDNTLLLYEPTLDEAVIALAGALSGREIAHEALCAGLRDSSAYWADEARVAADKRLPDAERALRYVGRLLGAMGFPAGGREALSEAIGRQLMATYRPAMSVAPGAADLLRELHASGRTVGVVSNREQDDNPFALPIEEMLAAQGLDGWIDFVLEYGGTGLSKPDPAIFHRALEAAAEVRGEPVAPGQALHIGDNVYTDVVGALGAGLHAVLVDKHAAFEGIAMNGVGPAEQRFDTVTGLSGLLTG